MLLQATVYLYKLLDSENENELFDSYDICDNCNKMQRYKTDPL